MNWDDPDTETVGAAIRRWDQTLVGVIPLAFRRLASIENCHTRILNPAVVGFAIISFDPDVIGLNRAQVNSR